MTKGVPVAATDRAEGSLQPGYGTEGSLQRRQPLPREVWILVVANMLIAAGFGVVAPAIPVFARSFHVGVEASSLVISAFAAARLCFAPGAGSLVTKIGERRVYLTGLLIVTLSTGACAFAHSYWQLLLFRGLGGFGSAMFTVSAMALLIHLTPPGARGRASGLFASGFLVGNVVGPLAASAFLTLSLRAPFLIYAVALLVTTAFVWLLLRRSELIATADQEATTSLTLRHALRRFHAYRAALLSNFSVGWLVQGVRVALVPLYIVDNLHQDKAITGIVFGLYAAANVVALLPSGRVADIVGRKPLILAGLAVAAAGTLWLGLAGSLTTFLLATAVSGLGTGLLSPPQQAAIADVVGSGGRGGPVLAVFQMSRDVGAITGPLVAGFVAQQTSFAVAFATTGALLVAAAVFWLPARETLPSKGSA